jgi:D-serine deaminase-like pyridoxal phosphate-dependent protein
MWYTIANVDEVATPALLVYPSRVDENVRRMVALGGTQRCGRTKTNKMAEVIRRGWPRNHGAVATIAEAEMVADVGPDVLLAITGRSQRAA